MNGTSGNMKEDIRCRRCKGKMAFEKFYSDQNSFFGWHCVICGEILDPVILLHRLCPDADISIPETEKELQSLIKKYMRGKRKDI